MSLPRQKSNLWLEKCSPNDLESKIIQQRMGLAVSDVLAALSGSSRSSTELMARVWPRHSANELRDPVFTVCSRDASDISWFIRYKALGKNDRKSDVFSSIENNSTPPETLNSVSNDTRVHGDMVMSAREKELIETLQLSASDDDTDARSASRSPKSKPLTSFPKNNDVIRSADVLLEGSLPILRNRISPLPPDPLLIAPKSSLPSQNSRTYNAKIPLESKLLRRDRDSGGRSEKPPNPSVFSPLAVKVTGGNSVSSQGQPSADAVSTLASLPVQRLSNRENVPSAEKPIDPTENLVGRVLADAEAFCKPFKHFKSLCMNCPNSSAENGNPLCVKGKYNAPFDFSLKRVSPLPEFTFGSERPVEESIPPLTKKRRRSSNEINSLPVESACKNRTIEPLQKTEAEESKRSRESKWIIPTVAPNDLKLRLLSAVSAQLSSSSITDKLSAFRFLIKGLRVPGNINDTMVGGRRPLTAALVFHKKDKSFRRFVDCGTVTSPKRIATSSTQYDLKRQADFIAQTSPPSVTSVFTNTSPSQRASAAINTDPVRLENGLSNDSSFEYCLKKVLRRNSREVERTIYGLQNSTEEEQLTRASILDKEASNCWSALVKFVTATSSSGTAIPIRPFVCSCMPDARRLIHSIFCQPGFTSYPEKILAATRHILAAALISTSELNSKRCYEQALEVLAKTIARLRKAESKLLRRAWSSISHAGSPDIPFSCAADLCEEAKRWSELWYSALPRVRAFVLDNVYHLLRGPEEELRKALDKDACLQALHLAVKNDDILAGISSPSPPILQNGSAEGLSRSNGSSDSTESDVCTISFSTLKQLVKVLQITSLASESLRNQRDSEEVFPIDRFGSSSSESAADQSLQKQPQLPFYLHTSFRDPLTPMIVYIDNVLQEHRQIVECLANCPESSQYQVSINSLPPIPAPLQPTSKRKNKLIKSPLPPPPPPPPAFDDPVMRSFNDHRASKRAKHGRDRQSSSQSDETTASSEFSELAVKPSTKKKKHRNSPSSKFSPPRQKKHRPVDVEVPRKSYASRSSSVAPSRRVFDRIKDEEIADPLRQKRLHRVHKRSRGKSVAPSSQEKSETLNNGDIHGAVETYSPRKNSYLYKPSRPDFSDEQLSASNSHSDTYEPTYIPSVPASPPSNTAAAGSSSRKTLLHELPSKPSGPPFYNKWMNKTSNRR